MLLQTEIAIREIEERLIREKNEQAEIATMDRNSYGAGYSAGVITTLTDIMAILKGEQ